MYEMAEGSWACMHLRYTCCSASPWEHGSKMETEIAPLVFQIGPAEGGHTVPLTQPCGRRLPLWGRLWFVGTVAQCRPCAPRASASRRTRCDAHAGTEGNDALWRYTICAKSVFEDEAEKGSERDGFGSHVRGRRSAWCPGTIREPWQCGRHLVWMLYGQLQSIQQETFNPFISSPSCHAP